MCVSLVPEDCRSGLFVYRREDSDLCLPAAVKENSVGEPRVKFPLYKLLRGMGHVGGDGAYSQPSLMKDPVG